MDLYSTNKLQQFVISNDFDCKILFYGGFPFFCGADIINYLNYDSSEINLDQVLKASPKTPINNILPKDIFTIKELRDMFCSMGPKIDEFGFMLIDYIGNPIYSILDDNDKLINSLSIKQINDLYLSTEGLKRILCNTFQPIPKIILELCKVIKINIHHDYTQYEKYIIKFLTSILKNKNYSLNKNIIGYQVGLYFEDYNLIVEMETDKLSPYYSKSRIIRRELAIKKYTDCHFIKYNKNMNRNDLINLVNQIQIYMKLQDLS